ncbi:MAG: hypothetical protein Q8Q40_09255 [Methylococcaceae bacterium]|nr:hypothetical protein [Methylococcaceae bacterium]MDP3904153.1 hypothetical protein [Methylococcaceae bacterium]
MFEYIRRLITLIIPLGLIVGTFWYVYVGAQSVWKVLIGINPELAVAAIAAATTLFASTITVMLGRYYERKKEIEAHFRAEKIKIYDEFLEQLFKTFENGGETASDGMVQFLRQWQRKLVLWGGNDVLSTYFRWMNQLKTTTPDAQTILLMDEFFRALRADIGQSSTGLSKGAFANLILRHGDFFMTEAKKNPKITLTQLSVLEKQRFSDEA